MGDLLRVLEDTPVQPRGTFYSGDDPTDLDGACTVTLTRPNGTAGPASGTVTLVGVATGTYSFELAAQPDPTVFAVTWAGAIGGKPVTLHTTIEVVGAHIFSTAEAKAYTVAGQQPLAAVSDAAIQDVRATVTDDFETRCGVSFIPRFHREQAIGTGTGVLLPSKFKVQRVLSVTVDGVAFTSTELADLVISPGLVERNTLGVFTRGGVVWTEYVYGYDRVLGPIRDAALRRAAMLLAPSAAGGTVSSYTTPDGASYAYDPAGRRIGNGDIQHYGVPAIDSVLNAYSARSVSVA